MKTKHKKKKIAKHSAGSFKGENSLPEKGRRLYVKKTQEENAAPMEPVDTDEVEELILGQS